MDTADVRQKVARRGEGWTREAAGKVAAPQEASFSAGLLSCVGWLQPCLLTEPMGEKRKSCPGYISTCVYEEGRTCSTKARH